MEALWEVLMAEHAMEGGAAVMELLREEEEEDWRRGSPYSSGMAP